MTEAALQTKIDNADSNTSMSELLNMLHSAKEYSYHSLYDSAGVLPAADSANIGRIAFAEATDAMYVFVGMDSGWRVLDSDASFPSIPPVAPEFAGENYGYSMGGGSSPYTQNIDNYPFASDTNATNVGAMTNPNSTAVWSGYGGGSETSGYHMGGSPLTPAVSNIYKFPYAGSASITVSDTGNNLIPAGLARYGHYEMCGNRTDIYAVAGYHGSPLVNVNKILKFAASSDGSTITDYGDLSAAKRHTQTGSSDENGYAAGGYTSAAINVIEKFPWTSTGNATDVGDLTVASYAATGASSSTHGYIAGALTPSATNVIEKYSFTSDGNSSDVGDLLSNTNQGAGASSATHGYIAGGNPATVTIQKYSFLSDQDATDVGDLAFSRRANAGTHY